MWFRPGVAAAEVVAFRDRFDPAPERTSRGLRRRRPDPGAASVGGGHRGDRCPPLGFWNLAWRAGFRRNAARIIAYPLELSL